MAEKRITLLQQINISADGIKSESLETLDNISVVRRKSSPKFLCLFGARQYVATVDF